MVHVLHFGALCKEAVRFSKLKLERIMILTTLKKLLKVKSQMILLGLMPTNLGCGVINVASISDISEEMLNDDNELEDERSTIANTFFGIKERNIQVVNKNSH
ncbi:unnamed protein product [Rhizophagus irregularis]|nr:unnamed protein product [Rhizophagus irregularis]